MATKPDSQWIWMNGALVPYGSATVPLLSHSLHYGGGVFEGIRAYRLTDGRTAIFRGPEHYRRLLRSVKSIGYRVRYDVPALLEATADVLRANEFTEAYIRPIAYLGDGSRGLKLPEAPDAEVAIATWPWGKYLGEEGIARGIRVCVSSYRRPDVSSSLPEAKLSGNYLTSVLARREASRNGCDEALLLDPEGFVAEGSGENLFLVKDGTLVTPPEGSILPGLTRDCIFQLARALGIPLVERPITRSQVYLADEAFFTGTAAEVTPIREVDGQTIGAGTRGPVTERLQEAYFRCVRGEDPRFADWLTEVPSAARQRPSRDLGSPSVSTPPA